MRVLHVNSEKSWRGGEQQMAYLMEELHKHGVQNFVCCRNNSSMSTYAKEQTIEQFNLSFSGLKFLNALSFKKYVAKMNFDIIHTHTANAHTLAYYATIAGMTTPIVVSKRTDFKIKTLRKFETSNIKAILCVSQKINDIVCDQITNKKIVHTVYSGINTLRFEGKQNSLKELLNIDVNTPLIGNSSAIADQKDYYTFVRVAKRLPHLNFVIIGSGPLEKKIKDYSALQKTTNVYFTGFLDNLEEYLKSLDLFLITSKTEGLGTSILDAMVCKVPVVATRAGGIPEIVIDKETGLLGSIGDDDTLSELVSKVLSNLSLANSLTSNAFSNVQNNFSKQSTGTKTLALYRSII